MQIELPVSKLKVELIEKLGWGHREKIKAVMLGDISVNAKNADKATINGENLFKAKVKAMEMCIVKMTDSDGKDVPFTEAWLDNLGEEDGNLLYSKVDEIAQVAKKA
jgi:hypothetical protein